MVHIVKTNLEKVIQIEALETVIHQKMVIQQEMDLLEQEYKETALSGKCNLQRDT